MSITVCLFNLVIRLWSLTWWSKSRITMGY